MNYREKIRRAIACPQFGDDHYGEWGALRLDQRKLIKRLLDELDRADEYIKFLYQENMQLNEKIDKAIEEINNIVIKINSYNKRYAPLTFKLSETFQGEVLLKILGRTKIDRDNAVKWKEVDITDEER